MATMRVAPLGLNLRSTPITSADNVIGVLRLGQEVETLATAGTFTEVSTALDGSPVRGFASTRLLRPPASGAKEALLAEAVKEWTRFDQGRGRETDDPFAGFVGEMWQALGLDFDGRDTEVPWSAAYISFIMRNSGAYPRFAFSIRHADYIVDAIKKRETGDSSAPFWGFRLDEHRPQLGDLVCQWRITETTFDEAVGKERFPSHCDVVTRVATKFAETLGGNVSQTVGRKTYSLDDSGFLVPKDKLFAVLRNNE